MSVYTTVSKSELQTLLSRYSVGELVDFAGISDGIENTNYFVTCSSGEYVLTLFESLGKNVLPYYVELMAFFNEHEIPSAHPIADRNRVYLQVLHGKPAILMQRLSGAAVSQPQLHHCEIIGQVLARMHEIGQRFIHVQHDFRGYLWRQQTGKLLLDLISGDDADLLREELSEQASIDTSILPQGVIHADLFRDNVLFLDGRMTGILDFYNACNDSLLYDLAITVNDWCLAENGRMDLQRAARLCQSYAASREVTSQEINLWPMMLRIAALRFWLSRLWSYHHPVSGMMTFLKDPAEFRQILRERRREQSVLNDLWK